METVYLVLEKDKEVEHLGYDIIFVTDSLDKIPNLLKEYYGSFEELSYQDIRDSGLEYKKELRVTGFNENYKVSLLVEYYTLNEL
jgi:hypothetical protein